MLSKLIINNFVIIENIDIDFHTGLNIIIGETGAGKSIVIDAMLLLFGAKASPDLIRQGATKAIIEATFSLDNDSILLDILKKDDYDVFSNEIIIRREIPIKGNSRSFINDSPVTLSNLKKYSKYIVDFYGQNSQHTLIEKENQLSFLDALIQNNSLKEDYYNAYEKIKTRIDEYHHLLEKKTTYLQQSALFEAQINEINVVNPQLEEDVQLENNLKLLENAEFLFSLSNNFLSCINGETSATYSSLLEAKKHLTELCRFDNDFEAYLKEFESALITIEETETFIKSYSENIEFNPIKIEEIRSRLLELNKLKKKYGEISDILKMKSELEENLSKIENYDFILEDMRKDISKYNIELKEAALALQNERFDKAKFLEKEMNEKLRDLGIENAIFEVRFSTESIDEADSKIYKHISIPYENSYAKATNTGIDVIEFYISTNKGEALAPLVETASGGEISRIILALKSIIAEADNIPTLIFDEIDTGISGRIAQKAGLIMREISNYHQIIAVTHLPQIAAIGKHCVVITKNEANERISTSAKVLGYEEKVNEIAKMLSGEIITQAAQESAKELMKV